jgi:hypothetical protein
VTPLELMKNSDVATIVSRYACLDFSQIHGFPNPLPKDEYFLRNGPKFSGDDLSLTLKHISNFCDFTELLRVKHEDVFLRLFYDSFQGKCKGWAEGFPARSIRTITTFWVVFLETWMEKEELVADSLSIQGFKEWNDTYTDEEVEENFPAFFSSYSKSCKCSSEAKILFLQEIAKDFQKDIEVLEIQIQSQNVQYQSQSFEILFQPRQEEVVLPSVVNIEESFENKVWV